MEKKHSAKFLRQRKMMAVLPLLVIPFITMFFWALGGGKSSMEKNQLDTNSGLNLQLPDAILKDDKNADKLSFYKEAHADSLKRLELLRNDPYYKDSILSQQSIFNPSDNENLYNPAPTGNFLNTSSYSTSVDENEQRIYRKIDELNKQINQPDITSGSYNNPKQQDHVNDNSEQFSKEVDRLQDMMELMNGKQDVDPEMQQLNKTLDKILDIQNLGRIKDTNKEKSLQNKEQVFTVGKTPLKQNVSLLDTLKSKHTDENRFYSLEEEMILPDQNTIEAVIHEAQTLVSGAVIKMRLLNDIYINGSLVSKGNFVF